MSNDKSSNDTLIGVLLLASLLLIALILTLIGGVRWYLDPDNQLSIVQRRDLVQGLASAGQALAVFLTGAVGLVGLFFTWRNTNQARESTQRTLELTEQGQITERFTQAIDQLGTTDNDGERVLETRMGAIYALERIARESEMDEESIMEILTAYVRPHSPLKETTDQSEEETIGVTHAEPDIQAILDVIGRRSIERIEKDKRRRNLERTDLRGSTFHRANLTSVWFREADLRRTYFREADLTHANFFRADLREALFGEADNYEAAIVKITTFRDANLERTDLRGVDLTEAIGLTQSQIEQAYGDEKTTLPNDLQIPADWVEEHHDPSNEGSL